MLSTKDKKIINIIKDARKLDLDSKLYIAGLIKGLQLAEQKSSL